MSERDIRRTSTGFKRFSGNEEIAIGPHDVEIVSRIDGDDILVGEYLWGVSNVKNQQILHVQHLAYRRLEQEGVQA